MTCEICNGQGYKKVIGDHGYEEYAICECHKAVIDKRIMFNKLADSHIPKHFWGYDECWYTDHFKKATPSRERDQLLSFIKSPEDFIHLKQSLWLFSKGKAFKTSLAIQLGKKLLLTHKVKFFQFRKLMEIFLDFDNKKDAKETLHSYLNAEVIIIDDMFDLTRATGKEYQAITLYGFIEDCINSDIVFICTSNRTIESYLGDKLFSQTASLLSNESIHLELKGD